jgi:hypothetical protein
VIDPTTVAYLDLTGSGIEENRFAIICPAKAGERRTGTRFGIG